ncbi:metallophosphoesterase [Rossellomorea aquimaris]|uniref:metallophosphoesterase n=1 Tax=Rossellomorea aquimaris TaxID=189382 RepID=UPI0007D0420E|nr:metallophosphoesterase [Rossellomorea aquimaris]
MLEFISVMFLGGGILLLFMFYEAHRNVVKIENVKLPAFPKKSPPLSIFFISDIHKRKVSDKIIDKVKVKANMVIIGGDLLEKGVSWSKIEENLDKLLSIGTVYFIWGNNDYEVNGAKLKEMFTKKGVIEIINDSIQLPNSINLIGVDDASLKRADFARAIKEVNPKDFNILISHDPRLVNQVRIEHGIDITMSGHTHGGQIRLFGWGLYKKGSIEKLPQTVLLVSNGYGTTALPLRLGARAETHLITLNAD